MSQAALNSTESLAAYLLYVLGAELLLVAPIILSVRSPTRFDATASWLERRERPIVVAVSLILGSFFVWTGFQGLAS